MLNTLLQSNKNLIFPPLGHFLNEDNSIQLDLDEKNPEWHRVDWKNDAELDKYMRHLRGDKIGYGGYGEIRPFYRSSGLFNSGTSDRCVHLGVDIWVEAGTRIYAPLGAVVHSFQNNNNYRDYGPTIILQHQINSFNFYTLYGHLATSALGRMREGLYVTRGEYLGEVGTAQENGGWSPHLHFQVILDLHERWGDFPGVATRKDAEAYLNGICPDPRVFFYQD